MRIESLRSSRTAPRRAAIALAALGAIAAALSSAPATGEESKDTLVPRIAQGRETFGRICGRCHGIEKPEAKNVDRPAWAGIVAAMEARGATMTPEERELVLDYLGLRNVFLSRCTTCHTTERILDRTQPFEGWRETVARMGAKGSGFLAEGEARSIAAYLTVIRGEGAR